MCGVWKESIFQPLAILRTVRDTATKTPPLCSASKVYIGDMCSGLIGALSYCQYVITVTGRSHRIRNSKRNRNRNLFNRNRNRKWCQFTSVAVTVVVTIAVNVTVVVTVAVNVTVDVTGIFGWVVC